MRRYRAEGGAHLLAPAIRVHPPDAVAFIKPSRPGPAFGRGIAEVIFRPRPKFVAAPQSGHCQSTELPAWESRFHKLALSPSLIRNIDGSGFGSDTPCLLENEQLNPATASLAFGITASRFGSQPTRSQDRQGSHNRARQYNYKPKNHCTSTTSNSPQRLSSGCIVKNRRIHTVRQPVVPLSRGE